MIFGLKKVSYGLGHCAGNTFQHGLILQIEQIRAKISPLASRRTTQHLIKALFIIQIEPTMNEIWLLVQSSAADTTHHVVKHKFAIVIHCLNRDEKEKHLCHFRNKLAE